MNVANGTATTVTNHKNIDHDAEQACRNWCKRRDASDDERGSAGKRGFAREISEESTRRGRCLLAPATFHLKQDL